MFKDNHESYYMEQLEHQISMLIDSCHAYDSGKFYQAKNLSNNIRAIVKDVKNPTPKTRTKSVLFHLNRKDEMKFFNTGFEAKDPIISINLVGIASVPSKLPTATKQFDHIYLPLLNKSRQIDVKWLSFDEWWNSNIIVYKSEDIDVKFTREMMVLTMAEQDGGTHVDAIDQVEIDYFELASATKHLFTNVDNKDNKSPIINLHYALLRQIAHELIISLKKEFTFNIPYNASNHQNLRGVPESNIKQFGVFAEAGNESSIRTKKPFMELPKGDFKPPENAAYAKFFF